VHLFSGRRVAEVPLALRRAAIGDINGDGVPERADLAFAVGSTLRGVPIPFRPRAVLRVATARVDVACFR
jgi:hypothetical protein